MINLASLLCVWEEHSEHLFQSVVVGRPRSHMLIYQVMERCGEINATQVYPIKLVDQISCKPYVTAPGGLLSGWIQVSSVYLI